MVQVENEMTWDEHQTWESEWWGDCTNTFAEETKHLTYAYKMGLPITADYGKWPVYPVFGKRILDVGGGPVSMLLKAQNRGENCVVADPCKYPTWVETRYRSVGISYVREAGERLGAWTQDAFDEVWMYNVLQHVQDPALIIHNAKLAAPVIRFFDWVNLPTSEGHPHVLRPAELDDWLGGTGNVEDLEENGCIGPAYYGVFGS